MGCTLACWSDVRFNFSVRCPRPNAWPCAHPAPPGPGCAYTTTKPPTAIAPATASANVFLFIVCFIVVLLCAPRAFQNMTGCKDDRLQNFWVTKRWEGPQCPDPSRHQGRVHVETNCLAETALYSKL